MNVLFLEDDLRYKFQQLITFGNDLTASLNTTHNLMNSLKQHGMTDSLKLIMYENKLIPIDREFNTVTMSTGVEGFTDVLSNIINSISKYISTFIKLVKDFINDVRTQSNVKFDVSMCKDIPIEVLKSIEVKSYPWQNVQLFNEAYLSIIDMISTINVRPLSDLLNDDNKPLNLNNDTVSEINTLCLNTIKPFKVLGIVIAQQPNNMFKTTLSKITILEKIQGTFESLGYVNNNGFDSTISDMLNGPSNKRIMNIMLNKISELEDIQKTINIKNNKSEAHNNQYMMDHYSTLLNSITSLLYLCNHIVTVFATRTEVFAEICKFPKFAVVVSKKKP